MLKRTITAIIMALVFLPVLFVGGWAFCLMCAVLSYVAGYELLKMMENEDFHFQRLKYVMPLWNVYTVILFKLDSDFVIPCVIFAVLSILALCILRPNFKIKSAISMVFAYLYSGVMLGLAVNIRLVDNGLFINSSFYRFAYLLLVVVFTDMGAYLIGCAFGKKKLCPTISPNKTIGGAVGGLLCGTLMGILFIIIAEQFLYNASLFGYTGVWNYVLIVLMTLLLSVATQIGDLLASKLKRQYGIKDYGTIFPGHGGVMDRFDSMIFAGTLFAAILMFI